MAEDADKPKRRLIKKVETVREKAEKASSENASKPRRLHGTKNRIKTPFRTIGRLGKFLGKYKILRAIGLILLPPYFRNSWKELKQVTWTKFSDSLRLTFAVIAFAAVFGTMVAILDYGLDKVFKEVLLK